MLKYLGVLPAFCVYCTLKNKDKIEADLDRYGCNLSFSSLVKVLLKDKAFRRVFLERIKEQDKMGYMVLRIFYHPLESFGFGIDSDRVGGGLRVHHGSSTIIHAERIGKNFTVYQNVTVGKGKELNGRNMPIIGDNVTVYTGAIVIGGIRVGNNCQIGAGAVVVKDVPSNSTVVGNPMRIVQHE